MRLVRPLVLFVALAVALSGCSVLPIGRDANSIESTLESIDGIQSAHFASTPNKNNRDVSVLTVHVAQGWRVADTAALSDYLLRTVWTYGDDADSVQIFVDGGVPHGFDWFDSVVEGRKGGSEHGRSFPYFQTYDPLTNRSLIAVDGSGMELMYGQGPLPRPSVPHDMLEKGAVKAVTPSAILSPDIGSSQDDEDGKYFAFDAYLNTVEATPYIGQVTVTVSHDGTTIATGVSDPLDADDDITIDNSVRVELYAHPVDGEEYVVTISPSPQDGFDTAAREYTYTTIG